MCANHPIKIAHSTDSLTHDLIQTYVKLHLSCGGVIENLPMNR